MIAYKIKKIIFFKKEKAFFAEDDGEITHLLENALLYDSELSDETIRSFYDDDVQNDIEIWKVRISIETISE